MGVSLAAGLGEVGCDGLALRLKAKPGSALAIGRDPEIADKTGAGRGHGRSLGQVYHFGKRTFDRVIHPAIIGVFLFDYRSRAGIKERAGRWANTGPALTLSDEEHHPWLTQVCHNPSIPAPSPLPNGRLLISGCFMTEDYGRTAIHGPAGLSQE